jgi:hypothetical protein
VKKGVPLMDTIKLSAHISEDKKLIIDLPADLSSGPVEVIITPQQAATKPTYTPIYPKAWVEKREQLRQKMLEAGILSTDYHAPPWTVPLSPDELLRIGTLPPGVRSTDEYFESACGGC